MRVGKTAQTRELRVFKRLVRFDETNICTAEWHSQHMVSRPSEC